MLTDAERDRAARLLRERYANGVLTIAEFEAQLDAVVSATSADQLHALLKDESVDVLPARMVGADVGESDLASLERHLAPGEQIYWVGHPHPRSYLSGQGIFLLPLAAFGALLSGTGTVVVPWPFKLVALFLLLRSLQVLGRFVFPRTRRRRTLYAVTDRRVISLVRRQWLPDRVADMYLTAIPRIAIHQGRSSRGALLFGDAPPYDERRLFARAMDYKPKAGVVFYNIEDPKTVKNLVEACRQHASVQPALGAGPPSSSSDPLREHS